MKTITIILVLAILQPIITVDMPYERQMAIEKAKFEQRQAADELQQMKNMKQKDIAEIIVKRQEIQAQTQKDNEAVMSMKQQVIDELLESRAQQQAQRDLENAPILAERQKVVEAIEAKRAEQQAQRDLEMAPLLAERQAFVEEQEQLRAEKLAKLEAEIAPIRNYRNQMVEDKKAELEQTRIKNEQELNQIRAERQEQIEELRAKRVAREVELKALKNERLRDLDLPQEDSFLSRTHNKDINSRRVLTVSEEAPKPFKERNWKSHSDNSQHATKVGITKTHLVAGWSNGHQSVYDKNGYSEVFSVDNDNGGLSAVAISDDYLVTGVPNDHVNCYDIKNGFDNFYTTTDNYYLYAPIVGLAISPAQDWMVTASGAYLDFFQAPWQNGVAKIKSADGFVYLTDIAFTTEGLYLVAASRYSVQVWEIDGQDPVSIKILETSGADQISVAMNDRFLAIHQGNNRVDIYNIDGWYKVKEITTSVEMTSLTFSDDYLVLGGNGVVEIYQTGSWNSPWQIIENMGEVKHVSMVAFENNSNKIVTEIAVSYKKNDKGYVSIYDNVSAAMTTFLWAVCLVLFGLIL